MTLFPIVAKHAFMSFDCCLMKKLGFIDKKKLMGDRFRERKDKSFVNFH